MNGVTWTAEFYLTNKRDSVPIVRPVADNPAWDETWTNDGPHEWHKAKLFRHGPKRGRVLIDLVYS